MIKAPPTPKGFRDILPELARKRREVINTIVSVLEESGFVPVETPTIEFADTLRGKYGEEERLIYEFSDRGGRELALRYDLTVPLARFVASNLNLIAKRPFRRYQIGQVFRGEKPQKGRFREFTQFDFDSVGPESLSAKEKINEDAKIIAAALKIVKALGFEEYQMLINDRKVFEGFSKDSIRILDKTDKIGELEVLNQLNERDREMYNFLKNSKPTEDINALYGFIESIDKSLKEKLFYYPWGLARGLDYYTGIIFELRVKGTNKLSVGGGGRYDNLIGMFAKRQIPAVGFSFGLDRLIEALG